MKYNNWVLIVLIIVVVIIMISLVKAGRSLKDSRKSFREEMALRLDLEEKISGFEKERSAFLFEMDELKRSLGKKNEEIDGLKKRVAKEQQEKQVLDEALKKAQAQLEAVASLSEQL